MHRFSTCAFLFLWLRYKQEVDVLKSTCYHSKYRLLPGPLLFNWNFPVLCLIPLLLCCLLIFVFCLFKIKTKALLLPSSSILGSGLPGRGWVPLSCAVGSLSSSPPRAEVALLQALWVSEVSEGPRGPAEPSRQVYTRLRLGFCPLLHGGRMCLDLCLNWVLKLNLRGWKSDI